MQKNDFSKTILSIIKAIGKKNDLKINFFENDDDFFTFNQNLVDEKNLNLPKNSSSLANRALSDLAAGYFLFHNKNLHKKIASDFQENSQFLDIFEKMRIASLISKDYLGIKKNIILQIKNDIKKSSQFNKINALSLFLLKDEKIFEIARNSFAFDDEIIKKVQNLSQNLENQEEFALEVKEIIEFLQKEEAKKEQKKPENKSQDILQNQENIAEKPQEIQNQEEEQDQENQGEKGLQEKFPESISQDLKENEKTQNAQIQSNSAKKDDFEEKGLEFKPLYKVFTNKFDEIISPQKLLEKNELETLRYSLDLRIDKLEKISKRLTIKLKQKLLAKKNITFEQSESEGVLDRKKFAQLIADALSQNFFVTQKQHQYQDTIVSILIDNSGSMRGNPIVMAAMACEIIASILEKFAIKTEILGFTTIDWKGGKSRKLWESQGREKNPGRLNDVRHIIHKSANQSFKKAKINLGFMLKEGVLKENIDGEASPWARSRLMQREEKRKILMIISDGTPVDDSTNSVNSQEILVDHLKHIIKKIEKENKIEIVGIGIGHNVSEFYENAISIKNIDELGDVMIAKIVDLI